MTTRYGSPILRDIILGLILVVLLLEATRRVIGPALPIIARWMRPHVDKAYADRLKSFEYLANVCVVLELTRSLSELYWMNVNDPEFPFVGVIEHTNLDQADPSGRRHIVYLSRYLPSTDPMFGASDDETVAFTLPHLRRMFTG